MESKEIHRNCSGCRILTSMFLLNGRSPDTPEAGEGVGIAAFDKDLDGRQALASYGPFVKTVDRQQAALPFLEQCGPQLFLVHRLDACVKGRILRLEFMRAVPLTPPASLDRLDQTIPTPCNDPSRFRRTQIPSRDEQLWMVPFENELFIGLDLCL